MARREYTGGAPETILAAGITSGSTSFTVESGGGGGYPTGGVGPFFVVIDATTGSEEKILCASRTGDVFTVASGGRGADDTTAVSHNQNATVRHVYTATDADEANQHVNTDAGVHGVDGNLVGTTDAQTLSNKTINTIDNDITVDEADINNYDTTQQAQDDAIAQNAADIAADEQALTDHIADTTTHGTTSNIVGVNDSQTLTNKTIDAANNTLKPFGWQHLADGSSQNVQNFTIQVPTPGEWRALHLHLRGDLLGGAGTVRIRVNNDSGLNHDSNLLADNATGGRDRNVHHEDRAQWLLADWGSVTGNLADMWIDFSGPAASVASFDGGGSRMSSNDASNRRSWSWGKVDPAVQVTSLNVRGFEDGGAGIDFDLCTWFLEGYRVP